MTKRAGYVGAPSYDPLATPSTFKGWLPRDPVESAQFFGVDRSKAATRFTAFTTPPTWRARVAGALRRLARWVDG